MPVWLEEFPASYRVPYEVERLVAAGTFEDMSWRHELTPSFGARLPDKNWVRIWVEHPDPRMRRMWDARYTVMIQPDPAVLFGLRIIATDDLALAIWYAIGATKLRKRPWRFTAARLIFP